ncbi:MAG: hypothetical protein K8R86_04590 [Bacteroidales bacterium]|nr:hypothetical protein [Bacteroidales bacterium]
MDKFYITSYCIIKKGLILTADERFEFEEYADDGKYFKQVYKQLNKPYAKFYKMDRLCKLAYLNAEFLLEKIDLKKYKPDEVALVFSNAFSSINIDIKHNESIIDRNNYFPEPATFVYTLPNIMLGELSIRHQIRGENIFFVTEKFDYEFIVWYTLDLLNNSRHKACIIGRIDYTDKDLFSSMFFVEQGEKKEQERSLTTENIKMIIER